MFFAWDYIFAPCSVQEIELCLNNALKWIRWIFFLLSQHDFHVKYKRATAEMFCAMGQITAVDGEKTASPETLTLREIKYYIYHVLVLRVARIMHTCDKQFCALCCSETLWIITPSMAGSIFIWLSWVLSHSQWMLFVLSWFANARPFFTLLHLPAIKLNSSH